MDHVDFIIEYETGECTDAQLIKGFQALIDDGLIDKLQGHYGRVAAMLIERGLCHKAK